MGYRNYYSSFPPYETVGKKKERANKTLEKLKKKNPDLKPVLIEGSKISKTWWGTAWIKNLEGYADFSNRLGRGRTYVKNGTVLDLQIKEGTVSALVMGSSSKPYTVEIKIKRLSPANWKNILSSCEGMLGSLSELLEGKFPKQLGEIFTVRDKGLFPSPRQISFDCSCPDWANMCKHVAAVLYGVGSRLDDDPSLFFVLRGVKIDDLISKAVRKKSEDLLAKPAAKGRRVMKDSDAAGVFGVDIDTIVIAEKTPRKPGRKSAEKKAAEPVRKKTKKSPGLPTENNSPAKRKKPN